MADRISVDFGSLNNNDLWKRGRAVAQALDRSVKYSNSPVSPADLRSQADALNAAVQDTMGGNQGSKTAIAKRDSLRAELITTLKLIVPFVEKHCDGDPSDSGFETYTPTRKPPKQVTGTKFRWIKRGPTSGSFRLMIQAEDGARGYEVECTPTLDGTHGDPIYVKVMNVKSAYLLSGLTPLTAYMFRVRTLGVINDSDWSDPVTKICT